MQLAQDRAELPELPGPPEELLAQLQRAAKNARGWSAFGAARAKVLLLLVALCRGAGTHGLVLATVQELIQLDAANALLRFFLAEILSSAMLLWHQMAHEGADQGACRACASALALGGDLVALQATPPRLLELLQLVAQVYVARAAPRKSISAIDRRILHIEEMR